MNFRTISTAAVALASFVIVGCSGGEDMKAEDTVIGTQVEAINEAKKVEQLLIDTSRARADSSGEESSSD